MDVPLLIVGLLVIVFILWALGNITLGQKKVVAFAPLSICVLALSFFVLAAWQTFRVRKSIVIAQRIQDECGKEQAMESETARHYLYGDFKDSDSKSAQTHSLYLTYSITGILITAVLAYIIFIYVQNKSFHYTNIVLWITVTMLVCMSTIFGILTSLFTRKLKVQRYYDELKAAAPKGVPENADGDKIKIQDYAIDAFPSELTDALVRRWYAVHEDEKKQPEEVKMDINELLKNDLDKFIGFIHPAGDTGLSNLDRLNATTSETSLKDSYKDMQRARVFLELLRPLVDPNEFNETISLQSQCRALEWTLFFSFGLFACSFILLPMHSLTVYSNLYGGL